MNTFSLSLFLLTALLFLPLLFLPVWAAKGGSGGKRRKWVSGKVGKWARNPLSPLCLCSHAVLLTILLAPVAQALDVQPLPLETQARTGFNYAARVTWDDLNAADNACTTLLLYPIPTNSYITRVGWYIEENFTNTTASATNLLLCLGVGGSSTNAFFTTNQVDGSDTMALSGLTLWGLSTNMLVPYKSTTSTNYLTAIFSAGASTVDTYTRGKMTIYFHVVRPAGLKF